MNCPNKELLLLLKCMSFSSTQHIADNNDGSGKNWTTYEKLQVTFFQKISENIRPLKNNRSEYIPPTKHPTEMLVNNTTSILVNEDVDTTSSSITLPNPEKMEKKFAFWSNKSNLKVKLEAEMHPHQFSKQT